MSAIPIVAALISFSIFFSMSSPITWGQGKIELYSVSPLQNSVYPPNTYSFLMQAETNIQGECRYSDISDSDFYTMTKFDSTGGVRHSTRFPTSTHNDYMIYLQCKDPETQDLTETYPLKVSVERPRVDYSYYGGPMTTKFNNPSLNLRTLGTGSNQITLQNQFGHISFEILQPDSRFQLLNQISINRDISFIESSPNGGNTFLRHRIFYIDTDAKSLPELDRVATLNFYVEKGEVVGPLLIRGNEKIKQCILGSQLPWEHDCAIYLGKQNAVSGDNVRFIVPGFTPGQIYLLAAECQDKDGDKFYTGDHPECEPVDCNDNNPNIYPLAIEVCNGIDDNCNGQVDENLESPCLSIGVCSGTKNICISGSWTGCNYGPDYQQTETLCDGLDNDCDGTVDEGCTCSPPAEKTCPLQEGVCEGTTQSCDNGEWTVCNYGPDYQETETSCDRKDNNCDGITDNIGVGYGVKSSVEATKCGCYDGAPPVAETCDGIDNDCDGEIDEGLQNTVYRDKDGDGYGNPSEHILSCKTPSGYVEDNTDCNDNDRLDHPGQIWHKDFDNDGYPDAVTVTQCSRPNWHKAYSELVSLKIDCNDNDKNINPGAIEICDGLDNDCDNIPDNGLSADECSHVCKASGFNYNPQRGGEMRCCGDDQKENDPFETIETLCDGRDNNCDGMTDKDSSGNELSMLCENQKGICKGSRQFCTSGSYPACDYNAHNPNYQAVETLCDGLDNDCDGEVDEYEGCECQTGQKRPCGSSTGECKEGVQSCVNGKWDICVGEVGPGEEVCDGLDNDCDGFIDMVEKPSKMDSGGQMVQLSRPCGKQEGVCEGKTQTCQNGKWDVCDYGPYYQQTETLCDGLDNDCDGKVDDGLTQKCSNQEGVCKDSLSICTSGKYPECGVSQYQESSKPYSGGKVSYEMEEKECDGLDNDCDGFIDEMTDYDLNNCGGCGIKCSLPNSIPDCKSGKCVIKSCNLGFWDANNDPLDGCECSQNCGPYADEDFDGIINKDDLCHNTANKEGKSLVKVNKDGCEIPLNFENYLSKYTTDLRERGNLNSLINFRIGLDGIGYLEVLQKTVLRDTRNNTLGAYPVDYGDIKIEKCIMNVKEGILRSQIEAKDVKIMLISAIPYEIPYVNNKVCADCVFVSKEAGNTIYIMKGLSNFEIRESLCGDGYCDARKETTSNCIQDCPMDDWDQDGIPDSVDKCQKTEINQAVNKVGCSFPDFTGFTRFLTPSYLDDKDLNSVTGLVIGNGYGLIEFGGSAKLIYENQRGRTRGVKFSDFVKITNQSISVTGPQFQGIKANLTFNGIAFDRILVYKDDVLDISIKPSYNSAEKKASIPISGFSKYEIRQSVCGDRYCNEEHESCRTCVIDCGQCPESCGNGKCDPSENCGSCPRDCGECEKEGCILGGKIHDFGTKVICGIDKGECRNGFMECRGGEWSECIDNKGPEKEICNGLDDDCDGTVDEDCICIEGDNRSCMLKNGVCSGTRQYCSNGKWETCDYGPDYQQTETLCDSLDNDCDGVVDNNCFTDTCTNGKKDPGEDGIDCGGKCPKKCPEEGETPVFEWIYLVIAGLSILAGTSAVFLYSRFKMRAKL